MRAAAARARVADERQSARVRQTARVEPIRERRY